MEREQKIQELANRRVELRAKLGILSQNLFQINLEMNETVQEMIRVNDEIRATEGREAIVGLVTLSDLSTGA